MYNFYKYRSKIKRPHAHQVEFVRQMMEAKRDGRRISVRPPQKIAEYLEKENQADLIIKLLAEHFSKRRTAYENYTQEQLISDLEGI